MEERNLMTDKVLDMAYDFTLAIKSLFNPPRTRADIAEEAMRNVAKAFPESAPRRKSQPVNQRR